MSVHVTEASERRSSNGRWSDRESPPSPFEAVLAHPLLTLLPVIVLAAAAAFAGLQREPVFTSEAKLGVGALAPGGGDASGTTEANEQLAATYSRAIGSADVVRPVARKLRLPRGEVKSRLSSTPIADSPLFTVEATGSSAREAERLAGTTTGSMITFVGKLAGTRGGDRSELDRYREAQIAALEAEDAVEEAEGGAAEARAEAALETANLRVRALRAAFVERTRTTGGGTPVRVVNGADGASDDRIRKLRLFVVSGVLAGLVLGVALATLRAARQQRRRATA